MRILRKITFISVTLFLTLTIQSCDNELKSGSEFQDCDECPEMVVVPKGEFIMGAREDYKHLHISQRPLQKITINYQFAVGKFEITREEYYHCFLEKGCSSYPLNFHDPKKPYSRVPKGRLTWGMTKEYVAWLSQKTGREYRLLSESEWEYAARAGTETEYWWGKDIESDYVICRGCNPYLLSGGGKNLDKLKPNPFGLYGMHGNLKEWLEDCMVLSLIGIPDDGSPRTEGADCTRRAIRGGSFKTPEAYVSSSFRLFTSITQETGLSDYGFRIATNNIPSNN